jgi:hypothetical protein
MQMVLKLTCLAPIIALATYILVIVIVICVYLKEHLKFTMFADDNVIELNEEVEIRQEDYENGDILPMPTGSPYYDRNTPNLQV